MIAIRQLSWPLALWTVRLTFLTAMLLGQGGRALGGADTNGVSPNTISRPSGPGSLEGLGASFQPTPFGSQGNTIRTSDLGFNKRIDVIQSQFGALFSWYNQGDGRYTGPIVTDAPYDGSRPVEFSDSGVHLADMNGDRLVDVVKITTSSVIWWANSGYGRFGPRVEILLPDRFLDGSPGGTLHRARLQDISGNGTTDLVYTDSTLPSSRIQVVDLGELIGGSPHYNLLTSIDYAYGRKTEISYRTTTE